jgi:hypothetical protein
MGKQTRRNGNIMYSLIEMLRYKRPEGSQTQKDFCRRFLEPTFGLPDTHGNYILSVGDNPNLCFTAHHDTVHRLEGMQNVLVVNDIVSVADATTSSCLGADCTTGIWLIMNMIEAEVNGVYVIHAAEEVGCKGSRALVADDPEWLRHMDAVISFDRFGDTSIITHQMGMRTASDTFAKSFADALDMPQLTGDTGGSYTDSNEYVNVVSECTNISVGYYGQHTVKETQDLDYAEFLADSLIHADWSKLVFERDPAVIEDTWSSWGTRSTEGADEDNIEALKILIADHPEKIAKLLDDWGIKYYSLMEEADIQDSKYYGDYLDTYDNYKYL